MKKKNPHAGPTLNAFLKEEGVYDELRAQVAKEKAAFQRKQRGAKTTGHNPRRTPPKP